MNDDAHPVVVAFDGSPESRAALNAACGLFRDRRLLVVSVWEPGLAMMITASDPDAIGLSYSMPSADDIATVDRVERDHAGAAAEAGAAFARGLGVTAEAMAVPDAGNVAESIDGIAEQNDAAAIVVGSRGLGAVKSTLVGSTSRRLLHESRRPVLVVRDVS